MFEFCRFKNLEYIVRYPINYCPGQRYPVILLFHGSGSRGNRIRALCGNDYFTLTEKQEGFPFVTVAPLCHEDSWFDLWQTVRELVEEVAFSDYCDNRRLYAVGASMGGYATWQIAMSMPSYFAAILPICGGGMYWNAERLKHIPVWAFHGDRDPLVDVGESRHMVEAVKACGGDARLTVVPNCGHEAWVTAYSDPTVFEWLLSHSKGGAQ